jgi:hypothetical protein
MDKIGVGEKTWAMLGAYSLGRDDRVLENKVRQSVGSDINWGIRFQSDDQIESFLREFCEEVFARLSRTGMTATHLTVTAKKKLYQGEPGKFLGCGHCEDLSRSMVAGRAIASAETLFDHAYPLFQRLRLKAEDVRGIGIHLKRSPEDSFSSSSSSAMSVAGPSQRARDGLAQLAALDAIEQGEEEHPDKTGNDDGDGYGHSHGLGQKKQSLLPFQRVIAPTAADKEAGWNGNYRAEKEIGLEDPLVVSRPNKSEETIAKNSSKGRPSIAAFFSSNKRPRPNPTEPCSGSSEERESHQRVASSAWTDEDEGSKEMDPEVFAALPPDLQAELRAAGMKVVERVNSPDDEVSIDLTFLAALPEDIRAEQLQWIEQRRRASVS